MPDEAPADASRRRSVVLPRLLHEARDLGFLGRGPVEAHLEHAEALAAAVEDAPGPRTRVPPKSAVDLGSGAGVPGLVLALRWRAASFLLVDSNARRAEVLVRAVHELGLTDRVVVAGARAEVVGRTSARRGAFDLVVARGFGRPAVVAECAAPFLEVGGLLVVSEPPPEHPPERGRWPSAGLAELGMGPAQHGGSGYRFVLVRQELPCPLRFPRRVGVPAKRPLFRESDGEGRSGTG